MVIQGLLVLTTFASVVQILAAGAALWIFKRIDWKNFLGLTVFPCLGGLYYYFHSPQFHFWVKENYGELIFYNISWDQWVVGLMYLAVWLGGLSGLIQGRLKPEGGAVFILTGVMLTYAWLSLAGIHRQAVEPSGGFEFNFRHLMYLTPAGLIGAALWAAELGQAWKNYRWKRINLSIILGGLLALRILNVLPLIVGWYL